MADDGLPILKILIQPHFDENGHAIYLLVKLTIDFPECLRDSTVTTHPASLLYTRAGSQFRASDDEGELYITFEPPTDSDRTLERRWMTSRETSGVLKILYKVWPSSKDEFSSGGPVRGLHSDHGGLLGSGFIIVPILPVGDMFHNIVEWDLYTAPKGIRAVWSYGEGPLPVERVGPASLLWDSIYMVGKIQSNPPAADTAKISGDYGYYWFGHLPQNIEEIKNVHYKCFINAQKIFEPDDINIGDFGHPFFVNLTEEDRSCIVDPLPYRSFVRNTGSTKSFGGTSFGHSHVFNYDDQIHKVHDFDLVRRMAYEMAQIWFGCSPLDAADWLYEGICQCLSLYIPIRYQKLRSDRYTNSTVNMLCTRYYTSPLIQVPFEDVLRMADTNPYAREHVSARAWAFVFGVDMRARAKVKDAGDEVHTAYPIEKAMIALANNKERGSTNSFQLWMQLLAPLMGDEIQQIYSDFWNGTPIPAPACLTGFNGCYPSQVEDLVLEFGMARESFSEGVVRGLQESTRAYISGVKNDDKIMWSTHEWRCVDDSDTCMELVIERNRKQIKVKYLPRSFDETKGWELREAIEEEDDDEEMKTPLGDAKKKKKIRLVLKTDRSKG
ncbi:hypothetical protein VTL71DRAFT_5270 [Oculimacula yallundae]|uniref:Uncharacterized protein n=1 Tax=Oculimacula yallundae TaxID=86028 RepID=A0ABR4C0L9_9HELO